MVSQLTKALKRIAGEPAFSDVILVAKDDEVDDGQIREVYASKLILSARSDVFRNMFYGSQSNEDAEETSQQIRVSFANQFSYRTIKSLVNYLYYEEISFESADGTKQIDDGPEMIRELSDLFNAAHYFNIIDLMEKISSYELTGLMLDDYDDVTQEAVCSVLYALCNIIDINECQEVRNQFEYKSETLYHTKLEECIVVLIVCDKQLSLHLLEKHVATKNISKIFNNRTCNKEKHKLDYDDKEIDTSYWLNLLEGWAKQSEEHKTAAQNVLESMYPASTFEPEVLANMLDKGSCIITQDIVLQSFRQENISLKKEVKDLTARLDRKKKRQRKEE